MPGSMRGWGSGLLGVVVFSGSLPATRLGLTGFSPLFLTSARAVIAASIGALLLAALRQRRPERGDLVSLLLVALGVVVGFPLLTALALQHIPAARSVVFIGLLPLATAAFAVFRGGERPRPAFWIFSGLGAATVSGFAWQAGGAGSSEGDFLMVAAVLVCGFGYAEGAELARRLGGWQVISWSLVLALAPMAGLALATWPAGGQAIGIPAWAGLFYVSVFSMLVGFVFWYRGLAIGGVSGVSQLQLLQPFFGLALAGLLLGDAVTPGMMSVALAVVFCVMGAKRFA